MTRAEAFAVMVVLFVVAQVVWYLTAHGII